MVTQNNVIISSSKMAKLGIVKSSGRSDFGCNNAVSNILFHDRVQAVSLVR